MCIIRQVVKEDCGHTTERWTEMCQPARQRGWACQVTVRMETWWEGGYCNACLDYYPRYA
ncbi:hypothetical protein CTA1_8045 [Colletotrichum tanaceti]|uniref:Uncharacterized protein n=1 Tax=Colletotrichum tanaceti TaxID=1306861 RepID=A0A4U6X6H5_9PEZI|nr:hypothetical protein CTA1_8045 [Colletotrichum tanaceti]